MFRSILYSASVLLLCCFTVSASPPAGISFPEDYRQWTHVKSVLIGPKSPAFAAAPGLHHIYANDRAMIGYRSGKFPAGAMIAFDLLDVVDDNGRISEGARINLDVMLKEDSGVWQYARFAQGDPAARVTDAAVMAQCPACHAQRAPHDSVISEYRP